MSTPDILVALSPVVDALERLGVEYYVAGSVAGSAYGIARATLDVDLVADLRAEHVRGLVQSLSDEYYVDEDAVRKAVESHASFNLIHLETVMKIDVFVARTSEYDRQALSRKRPDTLGPDEPRAFFFASPEDVVIGKLAWFRDAGGVSQRQWRDVVGILQVQGANLDDEYLRRWAERLGLLDLLEKATDEARP